jgi:hypothetical protein
MFTITLLSSKINMKSIILDSFVFLFLTTILQVSQMQASQTQQSFTTNEGYATFYEHDNAEEHLTAPQQTVTQTQQATPQAPADFENALFDIDDVKTDSGSCAKLYPENTSFNNSFVTRTSFTLSVENLTPDRPESTVQTTTPVATTPSFNFHCPGVRRIFQAYQNRTSKPR